MTLLVPLMFQSHRASLSCYTISYLWVCCLCCSFLSEIAPFAPVLVGSPYSPILLYLFIYCIVQSLSHVWLCDPMDCSTPGFPVLHHLPEFAQTRSLSWWRHPTISSSVVPLSSCLQSFPTRIFSNELVLCVIYLYAISIEKPSTPSEVRKLILLKNLHIL